MWGNVAGLALAGGAVWLLTHTFSGRGAFIHLGAMFGTIMVLNVWVHILPNQRAIIAAAQAGRSRITSWARRPSAARCTTAT